MHTKIVLADDHQIIRDGIKVVIDQESDMKVVGEADSGREAIVQTAKLIPDVVVMDIGMNDLNGIEATRHIRKEHPGVKIIGLSMYADKRYVVAMLKAGASGYLLKSSAVKELVQAIRTVCDHKKYISPSISQVVIDELTREIPKEDLTAYDKLTGREREVLQLLAEGNATKEIANKLHISVSTVETHRRQLMDKLDLFSVAELTKYAIREGLTSVDT
jgi:DNA-binding NarL/FixJ family response regulator